MSEKKITDEALVAFVRWCRLNDGQLVTEPVTARRVYNAYRLLPPVSRETICSECGNDLVCEGYELCSECLEKTS
jgi:hypothetical protein